MPPIVSPVSLAPVEETAADEDEAPAPSSWLDGLGRAVGLGVVAGLRPTTGTALLSRGASRGKVALGQGSLGRRLASAGTARLLTLMAGSELVADKLPILPSRLKPGPLLIRLGDGGVLGALTFRGSQLPAWSGGLAGSCGALAGSYAGAQARRTIGARTGLPDPVVAVGEDLLALAAGKTLIRRPWLGLPLFSVAVLAAWRLPAS